jgi:hypothetical protein
MYATFFVVAALYFALRLSSSKRQLGDALLAGTATGLAFVSKYPAVLVAVPVVLTLFTARVSLWVRMRLLLASAVASVVAAVAAMPALVLRLPEVISQARGAAGFYQTHAIGSFWNQAISRAEWDQPLDYPELGMTYVLLTAAGVVVGLVDRKTARSVGIWVFYAALTVLFLLQFPFRPFRNMLPLVPLTCVACAVLFVRIRSLVFRPWLVEAVAVVIVFVLFGPALVSYAENRLRCVDSRVEVMDWLLTNREPGDTIVFHPGVAFLPSEIGRLAGRGEVGRRPGAETDFFVVGLLPEAGGDPLALTPSEEPSGGYVLQAEFGEDETPSDPGFWRRNRQAIRIFARARAVGL